MSPHQVICRVPKTCSLRGVQSPKRVNRIVLYEPVDCKKPFVPPPVSSTFGTPIRVTFGRIKGVTPPEICDCPEMQCVTTTDILKARLLAMAKLSILLAFIYEAWDLGIWSDAEGTAELTYNYRKWAKDFYFTSNQIKRTPEEIYDMRRISYNMLNVWNNIQLALNHVVQQFPDIVIKLYNKLTSPTPTGDKAKA